MLASIYFDNSVALPLRKALITSSIPLAGLKAESIKNKAAQVSVTIFFIYKSLIRAAKSEKYAIKKMAFFHRLNINKTFAKDIDLQPINES